MGERRREVIGKKEKRVGERRRGEGEWRIR